MSANPLRDRIVEVIRREGPIPFSRYMQMCLYETGMGYYARPREQFGKAGDFYTSSDVHAVFGRLLCRQFEEMWRVLGSPKQIDLVEMGPGRGLLALDVLDWAAKKFPEFSTALHYRLVETSEWLRDKLQERLSKYVASGHATVHALVEEVEPKLGHVVIAFGNEFFDALPVDIVTAAGEVRVDADDTGKFVERTVPARPELLDYLDNYSVRPEEDGRVEVNLLSMEHIRRVATLFENRRGFGVFIDYGYTREEQQAGRHLDTLMTYRQHQAGGDPYEAPGDQDITTHVNFTALEAAAKQCGLDSLALVKQSQFLIGIGEANEFADAFEDNVLPQERAKVALQLKHLVTPVGIGEVFDVLVLGRGVPSDTARALHGLKFAR
ncbi:MAG: SAM-dependent methyltransferase [Terriglobia bacterium]|jgi:SAM-dependent MidA family methyltransferase|nr:SAM-dependent methyltransferase [Terriglobia bacterium]